ncbi:MAG: DNA-deoxyinosine glycosylase [Lachnospiraceae bacterium]|nr:DNA-deoxyinosine glycosylase [Lachnospiraceae bacterium]
MELKPEVHPFEPVCDAESRVLILGSFPSVKSRECGFYYGHPQNRFWKVTAAVCGCGVPATTVEKKDFLHKNRIALWDTIASCRIRGSGDSSIRDAVPNEIGRVLQAAPIRLILCNGTTSWNLFRKYCMTDGMPHAMKMPSTSPANAAWSLERLTEAWMVLRDYI